MRKVVAGVIDQITDYVSIGMLLTGSDDVVSRSARILAVLNLVVILSNGLLSMWHNYRVDLVRKGMEIQTTTEQQNVEQKRLSTTLNITQSDDTNRVSTTTAPGGNVVVNQEETLSASVLFFFGCSYIFLYMTPPCFHIKNTVK